MTKETHQHTPRELGLMVRELMDDEDLTLDQAVAKVHKKIRSNGLKNWWDGIGEWAIREAERDLLRSKSMPARRRGPQGFGSKPAPTNKSWRERYENDPDLVWDLEFPVGQTGQRKRLGDFTRLDIFAVRDFYIGMADTMRFRGEYWGRIGEAMQEGETLEEAHEAGRVASAHLAFLGERGRVDAGPMAGLADVEDGAEEDAA